MAQEHEDLLPCPFCGERLEEVEGFKTRSTTTMGHPDNECFLRGSRVVLSDREWDRERVEAWNRRAPSPVQP